MNTAPTAGPKPKDSGSRESFGTGAVRDTEDGKPQLSLLPTRALWRVGSWYTAGAKKYDSDNWRKGIPFRRCLNSAFRHLFSWAFGDRSEDHLSAIVFNILAIIEFEEQGRTDLNDLGPFLSPPPQSPPSPSIETGVCRACNKNFKFDDAFFNYIARRTGVGHIKCPHCGHLNEATAAKERFRNRNMGMCWDEKCGQVFDLSTAEESELCEHKGLSCPKCGKWNREDCARERFVEQVSVKMPPA